MTQALERIREVAKQRKKERFTSLFHHISVELLRMAFFALKRDAAPGVDGLTSIARSREHIGLCRLDEKKRGAQDTELERLSRFCFLKAALMP